MIKVYIAGKISGDNNYVSKFERVERMIRVMGYKVLNPAIQPQGMSSEYYVKTSLTMLEECDCVYFMEDWETSKGATLERLYCDYTEKPYATDLGVLRQITKLLEEAEL